ncbi:hypothetical protein HRD49_40310 [Corallococcus exiguus]|uniref:hypothetical protein n=1 Tax=Corallococcus exiguus TaxID=83462 RepID=UPI00155F71D8|nr:hypothetical protein [Corallococcus exiguus]NRD67993.1 hypothetical protein [Corallococcus exiguus]
MAARLAGSGMMNSMSSSGEKGQPFIVFWSWQSDSDSSVNRNFVGDCIERAVKKVSKSEGMLISVDRDTQGVGGSPSIADTILKKIRSSDIFVFDATHVYRSPRPAPNPNVALELGYALAVLGENRVIGVRNVAGAKKEEEPPFDFRHRRWPIDYSLRPMMGWAQGVARHAKVFARLFHARRAVARDKLVKDLEGAIAGALKEPKQGALRGDSDLAAAARLWALISSEWLLDWVNFRLNYPQYEDKETLNVFASYVNLTHLPENHFIDEVLSARHEQVIGAVNRYRSVSARERIPDANTDQYVISAKANAERFGHKENDRNYERQVAAVEESVETVKEAWGAYVQELRERYPEVVGSSKVK